MDALSLGSLESTQEARVARGSSPRATLTLPSCSLNFPRASITRYTYAKHEPILKYFMVFAFPFKFSKFLCDSFLRCFCCYFTDAIAHVR